MTERPSSSMPKSFNGINHLKLPCFNIRKTHNFYTKILPFKPLPHYDHFNPQKELFAKMAMYEPTKTIVEFRYVPEQATAQKGWDPITWGVGTRKDLQEWAEWFDANEVWHSKILVGIKGWVMGCEDPDGRVVRLYVDDEEHEWTNHPDQDEFWLGGTKGDPDV